MVSRDEAQQKWIRNFQARIGTMASRLGDSDAFVNGVSNYLGVSESDIRNSESGQAVISSFETGSDLSQSEIEQLIVDNTPGASSLDDAMQQLADKWDQNYEEAFTG